ncbi:NeuD/PglB/VioB family sugar acetyltransferase [Salinispira pacifica]|uniref:4-amino-6-deoxy-N-Acetyl-D-hexosaminyl-(Lipid carrier) acetyltrasferase n=1 Tax=Salinispira pacifica TaxID=1307761 RepID=V5WLF4_9SPIO|nr:NeuD/PglB/VioB family sugar acetyltransferase [Salinispira pacifica]AHC16490.1 4-amino-6-deoxy-N-Acetyl-D-hexosaminyl-(Lipid carrier) acetyltrasferase [Salinispira pacifica]
MKEKILLIGGGGHCRSCIDVIETEGKYEIAGIVDGALEKGSDVLGYPVLGEDEDIPELLSKITTNCLITVGQIKSPAVRVKLVELTAQLNASFPIIVSPHAYVSSHAEVNAGSIIMHGAVVHVGVKVGAHCIINSQALLEHDSQVGSFTHISTAAILNGDVLVNDRCFVGSSATLYQGINIASGVIVPAGSVVRKSITKPGVVRSV